MSAAWPSRGVRGEAGFARETCLARYANRLPVTESEGIMTVTQLHTPPATRPGYEVLNEADAFLSRFAAFPSDASRHAVVLWSAHTHAVNAFPASGRLAVLSDQPASGKTRVLELAGLISHDATLETDPTGPALTALISQRQPTVLLDEVDQIWGRAGGESHRQLRSILNSGYRKGATVSRRAGGAYVQYEVYAAVAFAGLGILPDTLMSRSIVIRMAQRRPEQEIEHFSSRIHTAIGISIGEAVGSWARSVTLDLANAWPVVPDGVRDRQEEVWSPLLAIAEIAGGDWPERARAACSELVLGNESEPVLSPGQRILNDLKAVWGRDGNLPTATIVRRLFALPGTPWAGWWNEANAGRELSGLLAAYNIRPVRVRDGERVCQGYRRADLERVWPAVLALPPVPEDTEPVPVQIITGTVAAQNPHTTDTSDTTASHPDTSGASPQVAEPVSVVKPISAARKASSRVRTSAPKRNKTNGQEEDI